MSDDNDTRILALLSHTYEQTHSKVVSATTDAELLTIALQFFTFPHLLKALESNEFRGNVLESFKKMREFIENKQQQLSEREELKIPTVAPELYVDRPGEGRNRENAVDFLNRVWGKYIKAGKFFQD